MASFVLKIILAIAIGLVGAALLHLVIILSLPQFSQHDAYSRVLAEGEIHHFYPLEEKPDRAGLAKDDPYLELAVCGFDLADSPIRLLATNGGVPFWSIGIYDSASNEVFSINDRTSSGGGLDLVLATPAQMALIRKNPPQNTAQSILVESPGAEGYVVLRSLAPQKSYLDLASQFLRGATCQPFEWRARAQF